MKRSLWCSAVLRCLALFGLGAATVQAQRTDISSTIDLDASASYEVREETYTLPDAKLASAPEIPPDVPFGFFPEMVGLVVSPVDAPGPRPVALFIHGAKSTCYDRSADKLDGRWPCPDEPVPSYRGFLAHQRFLAARGWVTVSVSVNGINSSIFAQGAQTDTEIRGELAEKHMEQWARWLAGESTPRPPAFITAGVRPDLRQLLLIGHSRGGSAANHVAHRSTQDPSLPWRVRAQVLLGPTAANYSQPPTLPTVVLLPGCDGDVSDLQGQSYLDRGRDLNVTALRSAVFIHGANHNFFNAEWDPGTATILAASEDDASETFFSDSVPEGACRPGAPERLSGEAQRELGSYYIAAAGKAFVEGDTSVVPLFDGSPVCAGPTCRTNIATHALGGRRQAVLIPSSDSQVTATGVSLTPCFTAREAGEEAACITADMPTFKDVPRTPHFITPLLQGADVTGAASRVALHMHWDTAAGAARIPATQPALRSDATEIVLRVIVAPDALDTSFALRLIDHAGNSLPLGAASLSGVPTNAGARVGAYWAQEARFMIDRSAADFDLDAIQAIEITPQSSRGKLWLLDVWSYAPGL